VSPPPRPRPLLFARYPALEGRLAWLPLATDTPTPVEPFDAFARHLSARGGLPVAAAGGTAPLAPGAPLPSRLYVLRDDRTSPLYGGNKVRKLEWILGRARRRGKRAVLTAGAWGSHHAFATALFAREAGMRATLILYPQPRTPHVDEVLAASRATGARLYRLPSIALVGAATIAACVACLASGEGLPTAVAPGGSDAFGTLGYVEAGLEIAEAVARGELPPPDFVYAAAGTCGTVAGLSLGLGIAGLTSARVVGVRVVPAFVASVGRTRGLVEAAAALIAPAVPDAVRRAVPVEILGGELGAGYGHATAAAEVCRDAARDAGLETETTYTAKALAGLARHAADASRREKVHLYVHTLGTLPPRDEIAAPRRPALAGVGT
jgi:D-cysteine desulfhydrase